MRILCHKKMSKQCYCFFSLLFSCLFALFCLQNNANADGQSYLPHAVYSSFSSTIHIDNSEDFSDYNHYHGCTTSSVDLFANNFYGDGVSQLYNVHITSRNNQNSTCLYSAGGTVGEANFIYNQVIIKASINGYTKNFGSSWYPMGYIYGSGGSTKKLACSVLPANVGKSKYTLTCVGVLDNNETLADYDIWFRTNDMFSGYPIYTMVYPSNDYNAGTRPTLSAEVETSWKSSNSAFEDPQSTLNDYNEALQNQREREKEEFYNNSQNAGNNISDTVSDIIVSKSSLLQVFVSFIQAVTSATPDSSCSIPFDLFSTSAYGVGSSATTYNLDLCSLQVPSVFSIIGTVMVLSITVSISYFSVRLLIKLLRRIG